MNGAKGEGEWVCNRCGGLYAREMRRVRIAASLLALTVGLAVTGFGQTAGSPQQFLELWGKAWDTHDVDEIVRLHADDCVTVNRFGEVVSGRDEIRRAVTWLHNGPFKTAHFSAPKLIQQRKLAPGLIVLQASWRNPSGKADPPEDEMVVTLLLKDFGPDGWVAEEVDMHNVQPLAPGTMPVTPAGQH